MDAVDPALVDQVETAALDTDGVRGLGEVRLRWIGHSLRAEIEILIDSSRDMAEHEERVCCVCPMNGWLFCRSRPPS